jgi:hypothetical protein
MGVEDEKKASIFKQVGNWILKNIRKLFFQRKVLYGSYADNHIEARYFLKYGPYIGLHYHCESLKLQSIHAPSGDPAFMKAMIEEQVRVARRDFRKKQESILFYVHDNLITRLLGFRKGSCHFQFTGEYDLTKEQKADQQKLKRKATDKCNTN